MLSNPSYSLANLVWDICRDFPNACISRSSTSVEPDPAMVDGILEKHQKALVFIWKSNLSTRLNYLMNREIPANCASLLNNFPDSSLTLQQMYHRVITSAAKFTSKTHCKEFYSVFATVLSVFLPSYVCIKRTKTKKFAFKARVVRKLKRSDTSLNDCLVINLLTWMEKYENIDSIACFPPINEYTSDPTLLRWRRYTPNPQKGPNAAHEYFPTEVVRTMFTDLIGPPAVKLSEAKHPDEK